MFSFLKERSVSRKKITVSFGEQALRNHDMIERLENFPDFKLNLYFSELNVTFNHVAQSAGIQKTKEGSLAFDAHALHQRSHNYLALQTQSLHDTMVLMQKNRILPRNEHFNPAYFDLNKIAISDAQPVTLKHKRMMSAVNNINDIVAEHRGIPKIVTAYYYADHRRPLFDT